MASDINRKEERRCNILKCNNRYRSSFPPEYHLFVFMSSKNKAGRPKVPPELKKDKPLSVYFRKQRRKEFLDFCLERDYVPSQFCAEAALEKMAVLMNGVQRKDT